MAQRATSLGPKPSLFSFFFLVFVFFFALFSLFFNRQKTCFPPRKGHFLLIFNVSLSFSLNLFWPPPFFCFSFSVSLLFFSFFLPSCLSFLLSFCFLFLSLSFLFFLHCFCFMKRKTSKYSIAIFFLEIFSLSFGFLSCFSVSNPFFLSLLFPDFKLCFLFNINVFSFKKNKLKSTKKQKKTNCNKTGFFYEPVFCKMSKVIVFFLPLFCQILVDVQKNTMKIGISANF